MVSTEHDKWAFSPWQCKPVMQVIISSQGTGYIYLAKIIRSLNWVTKWITCHTSGCCGYKEGRSFGGFPPGVRKYEVLCFYRGLCRSKPLQLLSVQIDLLYHDDCDRSGPWIYYLVSTVLLKMINIFAFALKKNKLLCIIIVLKHGLCNFYTGPNMWQLNESFLMYTACSF